MSNEPPDLPYRPNSPNEAATLFLNSQREVLRLEAELHYANVMARDAAIGPTLALLAQARRHRDAAKRCYDDFYRMRGTRRRVDGGG